MTAPWSAAEWTGRRSHRPGTATSGLETCSVATWPSAAWPCRAATAGRVGHERIHVRPHSYWKPLAAARAEQLSMAAAMSRVLALSMRAGGAEVGRAGDRGPGRVLDQHGVLGQQPAELGAQPPDRLGQHGRLRRRQQGLGEQQAEVVRVLEALPVEVVGGRVVAGRVRVGLRRSGAGCAWRPARARSTRQPALRRRRRRRWPGPPSYSISSSGPSPWPLASWSASAPAYAKSSTMCCDQSGSELLPGGRPEQLADQRGHVRCSSRAPRWPPARSRRRRGSGCASGRRPAPRAGRAAPRTAPPGRPGRPAAATCPAGTASAACATCTADVPARCGAPSRPQPGVQTRPGRRSRATGAGVRAGTSTYP